MNNLKYVFDSEMFKVMAAAGAFTAVSIGVIEDMIRVATAIGICLYIWLKLYRAYNKKDNGRS